MNIEHEKISTAGFIQHQGTRPAGVPFSLCGDCNHSEPAKHLDHFETAYAEAA